MSLARLWRDQGKVQQARTVGSGLRVVTEEFDTRSEGGEGVAGGVGGVKASLALRLAWLGLPVKMMIGGITGWLDEGFSLASQAKGHPEKT